MCSGWLSRQMYANRRLTSACPLGCLMILLPGLHFVSFLTYTFHAIDFT